LLKHLWIGSWLFCNQLGCLCLWMARLWVFSLVLEGFGKGILCLLFYFVLLKRFLVGLSLWRQPQGVFSLWLIVVGFLCPRTFCTLMMLWLFVQDLNVIYVCFLIFYIDIRRCPNKLLIMPRSASIQVLWLLREFRWFLLCWVLLWEPSHSFIWGALYFKASRRLSTFKWLQTGSRLSSLLGRVLFFPSWAVFSLLNLLFTKCWSIPSISICGRDACFGYWIIRLKNSYGAKMFLLERFARSLGIVSVVRGRRVVWI